MFRTILTVRSERLRTAALFLDRDGVLNRHIVDGYVLRPSQLELLDSTLPLLRRAREVHVPVVVVSNQGCVSRGLLSRGQLDAIHAQLLQILRGHGLTLDAIYVCPHHPAAVEPADRLCSCRKPAPGLFLAAAQELNIDLSRSVFVGDQESDRQAALAGGIPVERIWIVDAQRMNAEEAEELAAAVSAELAPGGSRRPDGGARHPVC